MPYSNKQFDKKKALESIRSAAGSSSPYFFIVGAGISCPSVPLAEDMIQEWRTSWLSQNAPPADEPASNAPTLDRYEYWFQQVYPNAKPRQLYLREKMQKKPIPSASFRLASILADGRVSRLVVTTNFDLFLSRALTLLEQEPLIYDSADATRNRFALQTKDLQILHVHGTYQYYDCANLRWELKSRTHGMVGVLDGVLRELSPIVIGYSGWEGDVIMTALKRRLYVDWDKPDSQDQRGLGYQVLWYCYKESTLENLPPWLKNHQNVSLVLPEVTSRPCHADAHGASLVPLREAVAISQPADAALSADEALQGMMDTIGIPENEINKDPITFHVRRLMIQLRVMEDQQVKAVSDALKGLLQAQERIREIQNDLHATRYADVLTKAIALYNSGVDLGMMRRRDLMDALWTGAYSLFIAEEESAVLNEAFQLVVDLAAELSRRGLQEDGVREKLGRAKVYQGLLKMRAEDYAAAVASFDGVTSEFGNDPTAALQDACSSALVNKGIALCRWHRPKNEEAGREILELYDEVIQRHGDSPDPALRESVASALVNKGYLLNLIGQYADSLKAYDEAITRFGGALEPSIEGHVTRALINKAFRLGENHVVADTRQAIEMYEDALNRLNRTTRKSVQIQITMAWNGLAFQRLLLAKCTMPSDPAGARKILLEAREAIREALKLAPDSGMVIGNEAYIEFLLGENRDYARERLGEAIQHGGEETRNGELQDAKVYRLSQDSEFENWCHQAAAASA